MLHSGSSLGWGDYSLLYGKTILNHFEYSECSLTQPAAYSGLFTMKSLYPKNHRSFKSTYGIAFDIKKSCLVCLAVREATVSPLVLQLMTTSRCNEA